MKCKDCIYLESQYIDDIVGLCKRYPNEVIKNN